MTKNLQLFAAFCVAWSVLFFITLHWMLFDPVFRWPLVTVFSVIYGLGFGALGSYLGRKDDQSKVRYSLGWRYSMTSTVISFLVGAAWVIVYRPDQWVMLPIYILIASAIQIPHWLAERKSIKGIQGKELFK